MRKIIFLAITLSGFFLLQACGQNSDGAYDLMLKGLYKNTVPRISSEMLLQKMQANESVILLDTRTPAEFKVSHIKGAQFVSYDKPNLNALADIPKSTPIVVYCSVGYRSERVGEQLQEAGFTNVQNLYGGLFQWVNEEHPVFNATGKTQQVHPYSKSWGMWLQKGEKVYGKE